MLQTAISYLAQPIQSFHLSQEHTSLAPALEMFPESKKALFSTYLGLWFHCVLWVEYSSIFTHSLTSKDKHLPNTFSVAGQGLCRGLDGEQNRRGPCTQGACTPLPAHATFPLDSAFLTSYSRLLSVPMEVVALASGRLGLCACLCCGIEVIFSVCKSQCSSLDSELLIVRSRSFH